MVMYRTSISIRVGDARCLPSINQAPRSLLCSPPPFAPPAITCRLRPPRPAAVGCCSSSTANSPRCRRVRGPPVCPRLPSVLTSFRSMAACRPPHDNSRCLLLLQQSPSLFVFSLNCSRCTWLVLLARPSSTTRLIKVKIRTLDIAPVHEDHLRSAQVWHVFSRDLSIYLHTHTFIRNWNEPYLPLPSQL